MVTFFSYAFLERFGNAEIYLPVTAPTGPRSNMPADNFSGPVVAPSPTPATEPPMMQKGPPGMMGSMMNRFKDGQFTGDVADAFYGNVQVKAVISGGRITDVQFLQYPNDRETSIMINSQAMPLLTQEAIRAQSAQVDGVSGATQTSRAFVESLQSALNQAK